MYFSISWSCVLVLTVLHQDGEMVLSVPGRGTWRHTSHRHWSSSLTLNPKLAKSSSHQLVTPRCDAKGPTHSRRWYICSSTASLMGLAMSQVPLAVWWVVHQLLLLHGGCLIAALLVLLYLGELLGGCERSMFPSRDDCGRCFARTDLCFHRRWKTA